VAQDTVIGMASSAPAASVGLTLALIVSATAYGSGPIIILTAIPMLVIANAYRRLNLWNANCGASFEWVGRAINPYLGFLTGWLMIAAYIVATVSGVEVLGPSVLAVFGSNSNSTWGHCHRHGRRAGHAPWRAAAGCGRVHGLDGGSVPAERRVGDYPGDRVMPGILGAGIVLMLGVRCILRSSFFHLPRESDPGQPDATAAS
jgi:amino acid transporter